VAIGIDVVLVARAGSPSTVGDDAGAITEDHVLADGLRRVVHIGGRVRGQVDDRPQGDLAVAQPSRGEREGRGAEGLERGAVVGPTVQEIGEVEGVHVDVQRRGPRRRSGATVQQGRCRVGVCEKAERGRPALLVGLAVRVVRIRRGGVGEDPGDRIERPVERLGVGGVQARVDLRPPAWQTRHRLGAGGRGDEHGSAVVVTRLPTRGLLGVEDEQRLEDQVVGRHLVDGARRLRQEVVDRSGELRSQAQRLPRDLAGAPRLELTVEQALPQARQSVGDLQRRTHQRASRLR